MTSWVLYAIPTVDCAREQSRLASDAPCGSYLLKYLGNQCYKRIEPHRDSFPLSGFCGPRFSLSELTPSAATIMGIGHSAVITGGTLTRHDF